MREIRFAKFLVLINCGVPALLLGWDAFHGKLGANPVNFAIRTTGLLALIYLMLSLFISPVKQISGWNALAHFRRTLGLYAFFSAALHFGIFFWWDRAHSVSSTVHEIVARVYLWFGITALLLMLPLAVTSTNGMINRLGPRRWKALHRLTYVAAIAGSIHYILVGKFIMTQAIVFAAIFGALLFYRIAAAEIQLRLAYRKLKKSSSAAAGPMKKPKFWKGQLKLARVFDETPDVKTFRLAPVAGMELPFDYQPGQYLNLALSVDGQPVNRSYTIASSPSRKGYCELTVKREAMGLSSRHLHDMLHEGAVINVSAPAGKFTFTGAEAESIVLIAGGVGITPLMSKLRYLTDASWPGEIYFIYITRGERDIIFRDELEALKNRNKNLHVTISLTREENQQWRGERGRLTKDFLMRAVPDPTRRRFDICGPDAMTEDARTMLSALGVADDQIKYESFTPPSRGMPGDVSDASAMQGVAVAENASLTFAKAGQTIDDVDGKNVLDLAEEIGVEIDYDCRSGICGTCKVKLLSGNVAMATQDALTAADRQNGLILACQSRCLDAVTVDA